MVKKSFFFLVAGVWTCIFAPSLRAMTIRPGSQILRGKPGKTIHVHFEIVNDQKETMIIGTKFRDSFLLPENKTFPVETWLRPLFTEVTLAPQTSQKVSYEVRIPAQAQGELAALVSFVPKIQPLVVPSTTTPSNIQSRIVTLITVSLYVRVKGTENGEADLGEVKMSLLPSSAESPASIQASVVIKNSGNVHLRPSGHFEIFTQNNNQSLYRLEFPSGWPVMPRSSAPYSAKTAGTLSPGDYRIHSRLSFTPETTIEKDTVFSVNSSGEIIHLRDLPPAKHP